MYLLTRDPQPYCDDCLVPLTVRHLVVECPSLTDLRHRYLDRYRAQSPHSSPEDGPDRTERRLENNMEFGSLLQNLQPDKRTLV
ncbi:hypothetical protein E2C01_058950 [Portunus trituberculatus]|uniref:Uncharacterized protein n=1 Tax=Portunus trituberculatus TaxID=210409 RepID=A0A5B7H4T0_PORTR|nr:hypothetical protein [Portunus trituberculatus]